MEFPINWHRMTAKEKVKWIEKNEDEIKNKGIGEGEKI